MIYPEEMTEIQLILPNKDLIAITKALASHSYFYQVDANYLSEEVEFFEASSWKERETSYAVQERRILNINQALGISESQHPSSSSVRMIENETVNHLLDHIEQEVNSTTEQLSREQKRLEQLKGYLLQLEPIAGVDFDISELNETQYIYSILGIMPVANINRLQTSLTRIPFVLLTLSQDNQTAVVWLAGAQRRADIIERAARSAYLNPLKLPDIHKGTPAEVIESLQTALARTEQLIIEQKTVVTQLAKTHQQQLQVLLWEVRASRMMAGAIARFGQLQYTYLIVGWVPTDKLSDFRNLLKSVSSEIIIDTFPFKRKETRSNVPVVLHNPKLLNPFQQLVTTLGQPRYEEIDPTILMALTFPLLFGAMFGDVGHGLVLALFGVLLVSRKVRFLNSLAGLGSLIIICGIASIFFGLLYGSIFGIESILPVLWMRPMENIMQILMIAIGAGVVILSFGFLIHMINAWTVRDWGQTFFDPNGLAGFVLYWSLLGLLASFFLAGFPVPRITFAITATLSGLIVMFSEALKHLVQRHRPLVEEGLLTYIIQSGFELFETLISFLGNTLSYVRVGAFAVAHVGLTAVIFILAGLIDTGHGIGYWIVVALGTLVIVGFEGLIVGIQTMRLEYYEFFSKFFKGGGMKQKPLDLFPASKE